GHARSPSRSGRGFRRAPPRCRCWHAFCCIHHWAAGRWDLSGRCCDRQKEDASRSPGPYLDPLPIADAPMSARRSQMMIENTRDIQSGMDVYGSDGEKIGSVDTVFGGSGFSSTESAGSSGIGGLHVETVDRGNTAYRDPTAPGADYTNATPPGSTSTDPTSPTTGGYAGTDAAHIGGTSVRSDMGESIGAS